MNILNNNKNDRNLVTPITRLTILISLTMIVSLSLVITQLLRAFVVTETTRFVVQSIGALNLYTNFVSAMLTNKMFNGYYRRLCGILDRKCKICWMKVINGIEDEIQLKDILHEMSLKSKSSKYDAELTVAQQLSTLSTNYSVQSNPNSV